MELAIFLPVTLLIIFGTIDTCQLLHTQEEAIVVAFEGARMRSSGICTTAATISNCQQMLIDRKIAGGTVSLNFPSGEQANSNFEVRVIVQLSQNYLPLFFFRDTLVDVTRYAVMQ